MRDKIIKNFAIQIEEGWDKFSSLEDRLAFIEERLDECLLDYADKCVDY